MAGAALPSEMLTNATFSADLLRPVRRFGKRIKYFPSQPPELTRWFLLAQRNLTEYFVAVDVNNMLQLYASMLHERRVVVTASKLSTVRTSPPAPPPQRARPAPSAGRGPPWAGPARCAPTTVAARLLASGLAPALQVQKCDLQKPS
ncbi:hypothetical protein CB1_001441004 [Camelus ferus]|nr:hypothetical protein CB1_002192006 [Camelus ferus]EPY76301.1 hypothetical protein CB1_001441004 [Camelus ferus]